MASSPADVLHALRWRYATKKFDAAKKIPTETWAALEEVLVLTPSSMGMQPWKFIVVTDSAMKARLQPAAHNQAQVVDCSHFVVFAVRKNLDDAHIDRLFARISEVHGVPAESLAGYRKSGTSLIERARNEGRLDTWQTHQLYIALGNFMTSAAILGVDTCPMEGIEPPQFDEILGLAGTPYSTVVACAAGYRHPDDKSAARKKVRFKPEDVIVRM
jgi:nitroreductase